MGFSTLEPCRRLWSAVPRRLHFGSFPEVCSRLEFWIRSDELLDRFLLFSRVNLGLSRIHWTVHNSASTYFGFIAEWRSSHLQSLLNQRTRSCRLMVAPSPCYWETSNSSHRVLGCILSSPKESNRHCAETKTLSDDRTSSTRGVSRFSAP